MCEGRAETRLLGGVEQVTPCLGVPCSAPSQHSLVPLWCSPPGPVWGCGLSITEALLPVLAASPHHFTGSWPRETQGGHAVRVPRCAKVAIACPLKEHLFHCLYEEIGHNSHNSCLPGAVSVPAQNCPWEDAGHLVSVCPEA